MSVTTIPPDETFPPDSTLSPDATTAEPARPAGGRLRRAARVARTTVVLLLLLGTAVVGGGYVVRHRVAGQAMVDAGTAVLTTDPIMVGSADAGVVSRSLVTASDNVTAGELLATVRLTANGGAAPVQEIRAPGAGVVTRILTPGAVARAGEPVAVLYDPAKLVFTVPVPLSTLRKLRLGMRADVHGPGLARPVTSTLVAVKPEVDGAAKVDDRLTVVLRPDPAALATVRTLVPGLSFAVTIDTTTAPHGTPAVNSA